MRRTDAGLIVLLFLGAARLAEGACSPSETRLCLNNGRFSAEVAWKDSHARTGVGEAVTITGDTGYFWFFSPANIELVIKVLDARSVNGKYWVFFGALSNVEYSLTVTDTTNGARKVYVNPAGQFASVGDTSAFDPNGTAGAVTTETVAGTAAAPASVEAMQQFIDAAPSPDAEPKAAADFSPCLGPSTRLGLTNCRFLLEVKWRDSHGRSGEGQAVQLTNDTGYFWFFSDANVELMVKVLDARAVNGNFWVFFGALSNVEYHLTVTDTLTHEVRSYDNPAGTLASLGDTGAFASGKSVVAVKDESRATSADIDGAGGTLTATAADGSVLTLEIPPDALILPTRITMTPLARIDEYPFSGRFIAGAQLEPEGLFLWEPAILTIQAASPSKPENRATFSYRGSGDEFILHPPELDSSRIRLHITHFSGYGHGTFGGEDEGPSYCEAVGAILAQRSHQVTSRHFDSYIQRMFAPIVAQACGQITSEELESQGKVIWEEAWGEVVFPAIDALGTSCDPESFDPVLQLAFEFLHCINCWIDDPNYSALKREIILQKIRDIAFHCIDAAYERCKTEYDPSQVKTILGIVRQLQKANLIDDDEYAGIYKKIDGCLRFEVSVDSTLTVGATVEDVTLVELFHLTTTVPVHLEQAGVHFVLKGEAPFKFLSVSGAYNDPLCTVSFDFIGSTFRIEKLGLDGLSLNNIGDILHGYKYNADLDYLPGDPMTQPTLHCPNAKAPFPFQSVYKTAYLNLHHAESVAGTDDPEYIFLQWEPVLAGPLIARKYYSQSVTYGPNDVDETTTFILKHTPQ